MKKIIFTSLLLITPLCKAADYQDAMEALAIGMTNLASGGFFKDVANDVNLYLLGCYINMLPDLVELDFSGLQLAAFPHNIRRDLTETLKLNNNRFVTIPCNLNLNLPYLERLELNHNQVVAIPDNLELTYLQRLSLNNNYISSVNPQILNQFPALLYLDLNQNPLNQKNVDELREAAQQANRNIEVIADDIGDQYAPPGAGIKPAKKS